MKHLLITLFFLCLGNLGFSDHMDISRYPIVAEWQGKAADSVTIRENGDEKHVYFYYIEIRGFKPKQALLVSATDHMMDSSLWVHTSKHGNLLLTVAPSKKKRENLEFDFIFKFEGRTLAIGVSFIPHKPQPKPVEVPKDKLLADKTKKVS